MSLVARIRTPPVIWPALLPVAYVANLVVSSGVSPYAGARALLVALAVGLILPWALGIVSGDRDLAGLAAGVVLLLAFVPPSPPVAALGLIAVVLIIASGIVRRRHEGAASPVISLARGINRFLAAVAAVALVAVGIGAMLSGRAAVIAEDLVAELPLRTADSMEPATPPGSPDIYLVLLDGYPRADKLASSFGVDVEWFIDGLADRDFTVAARSRSNHTSTRLTLSQMFGYISPPHPAAGTADEDDSWRRSINEGRFLRDVRAAGYAVIAVSPGWEHVALRRADRFIDTGQPNDVELVLLGLPGLRALLDLVSPGLDATFMRARVLDSFDAVGRVARESSQRPRLVFAHLPTPHTPLVFERDGSAMPPSATWLDLSDSAELQLLGGREYRRRLDAQVGFVSERTLRLVDEIVAADPTAVIVVFSDHGAGLGYERHDPGSMDPDLRTANLLAVRAPGITPPIDDRSTLANVLPRLLRSYDLADPPDVPETIYLAADRPDVARVYLRPD